MLEVILDFGEIFFRYLVMDHMSNHFLKKLRLNFILVIDFRFLRLSDHLAGFSQGFISHLKFHSRFLILGNI